MFKVGDKVRLKARVETADEPRVTLTVMQVGPDGDGSVIAEHASVLYTLYPCFLELAEDFA